MRRQFQGDSHGAEAYDRARVSVADAVVPQDLEKEEEMRRFVWWGAAIAVLAVATLSPLTIRHEAYGAVCMTDSGDGVALVQDRHENPS
jgi:hypothetical protein